MSNASQDQLSDHDSLLPGDPDPRNSRYLLDALDEHNRARAFARGTSKHYANGEYLLRQGQMTDGLFIILTGTVESLYESDNSRSLILANWHEGDFIGGPYVVGSHVHSWSARAVGIVEALHLDQACLRELVAESTSFALTLIECLGYKGERYSKLAQVLATHKAGERLALLLVELCRTTSPPRHGPIQISLIKQDKLAHMIGATRQSVSLAFQKLEESGALSIGVNSYFIHNLNILQQHAGLGPD